MRVRGRELRVGSATLRILGVTKTGIRTTGGGTADSTCEMVTGNDQQYVMRYVIVNPRNLDVTIIGIKVQS